MAALALRGHHLLCLPGFQGYGYSPEHSSALWRVKGELWSRPERMVQAVVQPDGICLACPHLRDGGCAREPGAEVRVRRRDRRALALLGIARDAELTWGEVVARLGERVGEGELRRLCATCSWFPLGYCREGLAATRLARREG